MDRKGKKRKTFVSLNKLFFFLCTFVYFVAKEVLVCFGDEFSD